MDKILDKLGVYDIIAVLLSGVIMTVSTMLVILIMPGKMVMPEEMINIERYSENIWLVFFWIGSYLTGMIFQEIGSYLQKRIIFRNKSLLVLGFDGNDDQWVNLLPKEKSGILEYFRSKQVIDETEIDIDYIFNYCKYNIDAADMSIRITRDQTISALSRSLSLYFLSAAIFILLYSIITQYFYYLIISAGFGGVSWILFKRCKRFAQIRYITVLRWFYYKRILK